MWLVCAAFLCLGRSIAGASAPPAAPAPPLTPAEEAEIAALLTPGWQHETTLRGSVGWRDNVLLSPFAPAARAFGRGELEFMTWRPFGHGWEFVSFLNGDVIHYLSPPPETGGEQQWFLHAETRWQPGDVFRFALKADGFFQDTVIDLSETETERLTLPARTYGGFATATLRIALPADLSFEPMLQARRTHYREIPGDYDETRWGGRIEWKRSDALALSAAYVDHARRYDERNQYTTGGRALVGTRLQFTQHELELRAVSRWGARETWRTALTLARLENRDRASGYFDYDQKRARLELGWADHGWTIGIDGEAKRIDYRIQTVGVGINPAARIADAFDVVTRVERELTPAWTAFAEHHWERNRSNEREFSYRALTVLAGVQRTF